MAVFVPGEPGDAGGGNDQAVPVGSEAAGEVEGLDQQPMLLATVAVALDGAGAVDALVGGTDRFDRPVQGVLVGGATWATRKFPVSSRFQRFFDSGGHRR
ncbi:MAG: hypothetical protein U1E43_06855 [Rhodospirillales bacterium]